MAACPICGRTRIRRKDKLGRRKCRRCGYLPGPNNLNRWTGEPQPRVSLIACLAALEPPPIRYAILWSVGFIGAALLLAIILADVTGPCRYGMERQYIADAFAIGDQCRRHP